MSAKVLQYRLQSIKKLTSYINSPDTLTITNLEEEKTGVRKGFQFGFEQSSGILTIRVLTDFLCRTETPEPVKLFGATVQCEYQFIDYQEIVKKTGDDQIDMPDDLLITLMSVSYSSARGILAALTAGTDYQNIFLPLINPQEFKTMINTVENKQETK